LSTPGFATGSELPSRHTFLFLIKNIGLWHPSVAIANPPFTQEQDLTASPKPYKKY